MASSQEYLDFIIGQLDTLDDISFRKMMGEYILYFRGKIFGGIYDDRFLVNDVDNKEFLYQLITKMYEELPAQKVKK